MNTAQRLIASFFDGSRWPQGFNAIHVQLAPGGTPERKHWKDRKVSKGQARLRFYAQYEATRSAGRGR